ncbi:hypothetical protein CDIK_1820 [Cucumispora dikerogammari]|nr:hypothetical protein CDIK_1820 [Cucumispora dikerogammari]
MVTEFFPTVLKLLGNSAKPKPHYTSAFLQLIQTISCHSDAFQRNDSVLILENCIIHETKMGVKKFEAQYLSTSSDTGMSFFPLSKYPIYLNPQNFKHPADLEDISILVSYKQPDKRSERYHFGKCALGVHNTHNNSRIGIIMPEEMNKKLIVLVSKRVELEISINIKVGSDIDEFSIMNISCVNDYINVSTIPLLSHFVSAPYLISFFYLYKQKLLKYKYHFLHYFHALTRINNYKQTLETQRNINILTVLTDCHMPVFSDILNGKPELSFASRMNILKNNPTPIFITYFSSKYSYSGPSFSENIVRICFDSDQGIKPVYNFRFLKCIVGDHQMIEQNVSFDAVTKKAQYSSLVTNNKLVVESDRNGGYIFKIFSNIIEKMSNISFGDIKKLDITMLDSYSYVEKYNLRCYISDFENEDSCVRIDVPSISEEASNPAYKQLFNVFENQDGIIHLIIYYEVRYSTKRVLKSDTYIICFDYGKIYCHIKKHTKNVG